MYYEYVTRKYNRSLSHFLTELDEFMTMGIIDHMLPAKIIRNIQYGMNENANFNINFYLPENGLVKKETPMHRTYERILQSKFKFTKNKCLRLRF